MDNKDNKKHYYESTLGNVMYVTFKIMKLKAEIQICKYSS